MTGALFGGSQVSQLFELDPCILLKLCQNLSLVRSRSAGCPGAFHSSAKTEEMVSQGNAERGFGDGMLCGSFAHLVAIYFQVEEKEIRFLEYALVTTPADRPMIYVFQR